MAASRDPLEGLARGLLLDTRPRRKRGELRWNEKRGLWIVTVRGLEVYASNHWEHARRTLERCLRIYRPFRPQWTGEQS